MVELRGVDRVHGSRWVVAELVSWVHRSFDGSLAEKSTESTAPGYRLPGVLEILGGCFSPGTPRRMDGGSITAV